jgi:hypothetical protein
MTVGSQRLDMATDHRIVATTTSIRDLNRKMTGYCLCGETFTGHSSAVITAEEDMDEQFINHKREKEETTCPDGSAL